MAQWFSGLACGAVSKGGGGDGGGDGGREAQWCPGGCDSGARQQG